MAKPDNDNEPFPFVTLGAVARRLVEGAEKQHERREHEAGGGDDEDKAASEHRERRLLDLAEFERRASGEAPWRRRDRRRTPK